MDRPRKPTESCTHRLNPSLDIPFFQGDGRNTTASPPRPRHTECVKRGKRSNLLTCEKQTAAQSSQLESVW
eukprot:2996651-Amphidinium_carterae.1